MLDDVLQGEGRRLYSVAHGEELAEGKALQVVLRCPTTQIRLAALDVEDRRAREVHVHIGERVVDGLQLAGPSLIFMNLIEIEECAAAFAESLGRIKERVVREVQVVGRGEECPVGLVGMLDMLQEECGFADASRSDEAEHAIVPVDAVVDVPVKFARRVLEQAVHGFVEAFHG